MDTEVVSYTLQKGGMTMASYSRTTNIRRAPVLTTLIVAIFCVAGMTAPPARAVINLSNDPSTSIVPNPNPYPFVASFGFPGRTATCTATLVAPQWAITAWHCLADQKSGEVFDLSKMRLWLNARSYADPAGVNVGIRQAFSIPATLGGKSHTDIALLRLAQPVNIPIAVLANTNQSNLWKEDAHTFFVGWGEINNRGQSSEGTPLRSPNGGPRGKL